MGYAIFTARKLMLTNRISQLNFRRMQLSQQQQTLSDMAGQMQRAMAARKNLFSNIANMFQMGMQQMQNAAMQSLYQNVSSGGQINVDASQLGSLLAGANYMNHPIFGFINMMQQNDQMIADNNFRKIQEQENQIELQAKSIETQLAAAQAELKAVEDQERKNIEASAPKFA